MLNGQVAHLSMGGGGGGGERDREEGVCAVYECV